MKKALFKIRSIISLIHEIRSQKEIDFDVSPILSFDETMNESFDELLRESNFYVEFGAGGTTLLADKYFKRGISVENDRNFASQVKARLRKDSTVRVKTVSIGYIRKWGKPIFRKPTRRRVSSWRKYTKAANKAIYKNKIFPDLILIDGRLRVACALEMASVWQKMGCPNSILFIDDYYPYGKSACFDRGYEVIEGFLGNPEKVGRAAKFRLDPNTFTSPNDRQRESFLKDWR